MLTYSKKANEENSVYLDYLFEILIGNVMPYFEQASKYQLLLVLPKNELPVFRDNVPKIANSNLREGGGHHIHQERPQYMQIITINMY